MTREEAIECLNFQNEKFFGGQSEALKMAISALSFLEREKGTDLISRKKALEMVEKNKQQIAIYRAIEALPSAVPEKEKREWIPVSEKPPEEGSHVLVSVKGEPDFVATDDYYSYGFDDWKDDVTAWKPAPEPYKGGDV